jgi:hypothetical protein
VADLTRFIDRSARPDSRFGIYYRRVLPVGAGTFLRVEPLRLAAEGEFNWPFERRRHTGEIVMPDTAPSGHCTVVADGRHYTGCPDQTRGQALEIDVAGHRVVLHPAAPRWSVIDLWGTALGCWAQGHAAPDGILDPAEDAEDEPGIEAGSVPGAAG